MTRVQNTIDGRTRSPEKFEYFVVPFQVRHQEIQIERGGCDEFDHVDRRPKKRQLTRRYRQPDCEFQAEPRVTYAFDVEECRMRFGRTKQQ